jgi:hypothetical protein
MEERQIPGTNLGFRFQAMSLERQNPSPEKPELCCLPRSHFPETSSSFCYRTKV